MTSGPHLSGSTRVVVVTMNTGDAATIRTSSIFLSIGGLISDANMKTSFAGGNLLTSHNTIAICIIIN